MDVEDVVGTSCNCHTEVGVGCSAFDVGGIVAEKSEGESAGAVESGGERSWADCLLLIVVSCLVVGC